jgi:hypothetical protein
MRHGTWPMEIGLPRRHTPVLALANEMVAAAWTAIGLLAATSLGTLFYVGSRIDALAARMQRQSMGPRGPIAPAAPPLPT